MAPKLGATVAVNVTWSPNSEGLGDEVVLTVVVSRLLTLWVAPVDWLVAKLVSASYTAMMVWPATLSWVGVVVKEVEAMPLKVGSPRLVVPSLWGTSTTPS